MLPDGHAYCSLVRPAPHWTHRDSQTQAQHHTSRAIVHERGLPVSAVAQRLNMELRGQSVYCDGWANYYTWRGALFDAANMTPCFRLENLRARPNEQEAAQWHLVKAQISSERGAQHHRASSDARLLRLTLQRLRGIPSLHYHKDTP